jgi:hypothetical protein
MKRLLLRPYNGNLFVTTDEADYQRSHKRLFGERDVPLVSEGREGRFTGGHGSDGKWTYLIFYSSMPVLAHELTHVLFHVWERCGIDPRDSGGEAFCYMLSQLMVDAAA